MEVDLMKLLRLSFVAANSLCGKSSPAFRSYQERYWGIVGNPGIAGMSPLDMASRCWCW